MNMQQFVFMICVTLAFLPSANASPAVEGLLDEYRQQGAGPFSAEAGRELWNEAFASARSDKPRRCASCHTADPRRPGKHARTGKAIEPLAPSVKPERLNDVRKVRKWFKRNCKWTMGRPCTAQEKGDVLLYLKDL